VRRLPLLPVVELEDELVVERDPSQGLEQQALLAVLGHHHAGRGGQVVDRGDAEVDASVVAPDATVVLAQQLAGDREQVGAEAGVSADPLAASTQARKLRWMRSSTPNSSFLRKNRDTAA